MERSPIQTSSTSSEGVAASQLSTSSPDHSPGSSPCNSPGISSSISPAGLASRALALGADYVVTVLLLILSSAATGASVPPFALSFITGSLYFTLCHSRLGQGQSFGKKLLGLRVIRERNGALFLSPLSAFGRYCGFLGGLLLVAEIPPLVFRAQEVVAPVWMLQLHMLVALVWIMFSGGLAVVDHGHRALHDRLTGSLVVRARRLPALDARETLRQALVSTPPRAKTFRLVLAGQSIFVAVLMWVWGIVLPVPLERAMRYQYRFEHAFPGLQVAVAQYDSSGKRLAVDLLALTPIPQEQQQHKAEEVAHSLDQFGGIDHDAIKAIVIRFIEQPQAGQPPGEPAEHLVDLSGAATL